MRSQNSWTGVFSRPLLEWLGRIVGRVFRLHATLPASDPRPVPPLVPAQEIRGSAPLDFVARQPILDRQKQVFAYELLCRSGPSGILSPPPASVESSTLKERPGRLSLSDLTQGVPGYLTFSRSLLTEQIALILPSDRVIVEIRDDLAPDDDVLRACRALRRGNYQLAFDDYVGQPGCERLLDVVTIVKVDFRKVKGADREVVADRLRGFRVKLLAERVDTPADFAEALALGYDLFQGPFLSRPEIVPRGDLPASKLAYLRLLREINQPEADVTKIEAILKQDVGLSLKLLRYLNSAWFGLGGRVDSLRHAITLLGTEGIRQWAALVAVGDLAGDHSAALVSTCLLRASFCERLAGPARLADQSSNLFLVGLFSGLDALVGRPLDELLREVAVPAEVSDALLDGTGRLSPVYELALAYERGDWTGVEARATSLGIGVERLPAVYGQSVQWVGPLLAA